MSRSKRTQKQIQDKQGKDRFDSVGDPAVEKHLKEITFMPSTLETIDAAIVNFINEGLNLSALGNDGFKKVPVIWSSAERSFQIKADSALRNKEGDLILPYITIYRSSVTKDANKRAIPYGSVYPRPSDPRGGSITVARRIQQKKTAEFQNADANRLYSDRVRSITFNTNKRKFRENKVVYETITMPLPVWVNVSYEIALRTEYQQQMNELLGPFLTRPGNTGMFQPIEHDGHTFELFIDGNFTNNSNATSLDMNQRNFETLIRLDVLGYLMGAGMNEERPKVVIRENAVEVKIPREHVILGDIPRRIKDGFYRE